MAKQLSYKPLSNLGINGLNTQTNPASLEPTWLTKASNIVLTESGRISFRKGLKQNVLATSAKIGAIGEINDTGVILAAVGTNMYTVNFAAPDNPWTLSFATGGSASDWQMIPFNGKMYCVQAGHAVVQYNDAVSSPYWTALTAISGYNAPSNVTTFDPRCGMGFYGRLWFGGITEEPDVLYYSDTLLGHKWSSGAAGAIDLKSVWDDDSIVAIAPFYGKLVIFGSHNIAIYNNPFDLTNLALDEVIRGVGCVSRDSIQAVGDDLIFLSSTGVRSLLRTTQKDKVPLQDYSLNIKDTLIRNIASSSNVKSSYIENEGIYVLSFVDKNITYVFDMKHFTGNNSPRITTWDFSSNLNPSSMLYTQSRGFLVGQHIGSIATYTGFLDKTYVNGGSYTNTSYTTDFKTIWIDLGDATIASLLKKLTAVIGGGAGTNVGIKWYKDFSHIPSKTNSFLLNPSASGADSLFGSSTSLYGTAVVTTTNAGSFVTGTYYAIKTAGNTNFTLVGSANNSVGTIFKATGAGTGTGTAVSHTHVAGTHPATTKYAPLYGLSEYKVSLTGSAKYLQLQMTSETNGYSASLQDMTLLYKQGKIR